MFWLTIMVIFSIIFFISEDPGNSLNITGQVKVMPMEDIRLLKMRRMNSSSDIEELYKNHYQKSHWVLENYWLRCRYKLQRLGARLSSLMILWKSSNLHKVRRKNWMKSLFLQHKRLVHIYSVVCGQLDISLNSPRGLHNEPKEQSPLLPVSLF